MSKQFSYRTGGSITPAHTPDKDFSQPEMFYAPHAFWLWNGGFNTENIAGQAAGMSEKGFNPGYVHARFWPSPPIEFWMSEQWLGLFEDALKECRQSGTHMSYTIGDPCFPHHRILEKYPDLEAKSLYWEILETDDGGTLAIPENLFATAVKRNKEGQLLSTTLQVVGKKKALDWTPPDADRWCVFVFRTYTDFQQQYRNSFIDKRLFKAWCEVEHDIYEERIGDYFGNVMRGIFVDQEGDYGYKLVWSDDLAEEYQKRTGRDIALFMPLLAEEDAEGLYGKARWDWFDTLSHVYMDSFTRPMDQWCRERNMFMTCHFWEGDLFHQAMAVGSFMHSQRSYSMPGADALFDTVLTTPSLFTETWSVAEFEGRGFFDETLTICGWHFGTSDLKHALNSSITWGVTHLILAGVDTDPNIEKVSYPPDFYKWEPYWPLFHNVTDFVRRATWVNDHGRLDSHVLMLCPMDSIWALIGGDLLDRDKLKDNNHLGCYVAKKDLADYRFGDEILHIDKVYQKTAELLRWNNIDFLAVDKHYLDEMSVSGNEMLRGDFRFDTLILPPLRLIPYSVAKKILAFAENGGKVIALGSLPDSSSDVGMNDPKMHMIMEKLRQTNCFIDLSTTPQNVVDEITHGIEYTGEKAELLSTRRILNGRTFVWIANNQDHPVTVHLRIPDVCGSVEKWNCETGEKIPVSSKNSPEGALLTLFIGNNEGFWLVFDPTQEPIQLPESQKETEVLDLSHDWILRLDEEIQIKTSRRPIPLIFPNGLITGMPVHNLVSWTTFGDMKNFSGLIDYEKEIELDSIIGTEVLEITEVYHTAQIWINGEPAGGRMWGPFKFEIGKFLQIGKNRIHIRVGNLLINEALTYQKKWTWAEFSEKREFSSEESLISGITGTVKLKIYKPLAEIMKNGACE